jgi:hypothetical protein
MYQLELFRLYDVTIGSYQQIYITSDSVDVMRSVIDTMFKRCLGIGKPRSRFKHLPTMIATEFCKGVTFFKSDVVEEIPFYHRQTSCGSKTQSASEKFTILLDNSTAIKHNKKAYVLKCYLERLIYDKIYTNTFHQQDIGHLHELQVMARVFQDYFPGEGIIVDIEFKNQLYPVKLNIIYKLYRETYIKDKYNSERVYCTKVKDGIQYDKVQTFIQETAWLT